MKTVILCGGSGTRLWPISRKSTPKQFAQIFDGESLFEKTINRNKSFSNSYTIVVNELQLPACKKQILSELEQNTDYLIEPIGRNTAAAIALAAFASSSEEILLVLPSDHLINDQSVYEECVNQAKELAVKNRLVTFGMEARYPETGFGYIEADGNTVKSFKEKPDLETAKKYVESKNYYWNSGMFCFKAKTFLTQLKQHSPEIFDQAEATYKKRKESGNITDFKVEEMKKIPSLSVDYAVMEKSPIVSVVPSSFHWSDLGSFDALYEELPKDENGNTESEEYCSINSKNNLILGGKRVIATFDVNELIIVDTADALLIGKKGESQKVKELLQYVEKIDEKLLK